MGGGMDNAAPTGCDNACQTAHLNATGNLYDDSANSYNDRFQRGELDVTTDIYQDADGNPVFVTTNDLGATVSTASSYDYFDFHKMAEISSKLNTSALQPLADEPFEANGPKKFGQQRNMDANGNCYNDESGKPYAPHDPNIYSCLDMSASERAKWAKKVKKETVPPPIAPSLTASQWRSIFGQVQKVIFADASSAMAGKKSVPTTGACAGAGASFGYGVEFAYCNMDVNGTALNTKTVGYSIGFQVSFGVGPGAIVSNATSVDQVLGWNACMTGSTLGSLEICVAISFDKESGVTTVPKPANMIWSATGGISKGAGAGVSTGITLTEKSGK
jgi:hypothetical protein